MVTNVLNKMKITVQLFLDGIFFFVHENPFNMYSTVLFGRVMQSSVQINKKIVTDLICDRCVTVFWRHVSRSFSAFEMAVRNQKWYKMVFYIAILDFVKSLNRKRSILYLVCV